MKQATLFNRGAFLFSFRAIDFRSFSFLRRKIRREDLVQRIKDTHTLTLFSCLSSQVYEIAKDISSYTGIYIPLLKYNLIG